MTTLILIPLTRAVALRDAACREVKAKKDALSSADYDVTVAEAVYARAGQARKAAHALKSETQPDWTIEMSLAEATWDMAFGEVQATHFAAVVATEELRIAKAVYAEKKELAEATPATPALPAVS